MKSKLILFIVLILSLGMLAGCSPSLGVLGGGSTVTVQEDLLNYLNKELPKVSSLEEESVNTYYSVVGENYTNDEVLYNTLKDEVMPKYRELIDRVEDIEPKTEELQQIHDIYVKGAKTQYDGFELIITAIEQQDAGIIAEANKKLEEGKGQIEEYQQKLRELAEEHDVTIQE